MLPPKLAAVLLIKVQFVKVKLDLYTVKTDPESAIAFMKVNPVKDISLKLASDRNGFPRKSNTVGWFAAWKDS
jgi:hypothetical protein